MFKFLFKNSVDSINVNDIDKILGKINLIDIRTPAEYKSGHLPKAKNIPMDIIVSDADKHLDKSKEYHIICQSGARSSRTCSILKQSGFNVINVSGGTGRYKSRLER